MCYIPLQIFVMIGNKRANSFWEGNLQPGEELSMDAPTDRRLTFITQKYKQGRFRKTVLLYKSQEELNKVTLAEILRRGCFLLCFAFRGRTRAVIKSSDTNICELQCRQW